MSEKPLEVRVAELLGCTPELDGRQWICPVACTNHWRTSEDAELRVTTDQMLEWLKAKECGIYFNTICDTVAVGEVPYEEDPVLDDYHDVDWGDESPRQALMLAIKERFLKPRGEIIRERRRK